jgi:hypothetical protein
MSFKPTEEQAKVISAAKSGQDLVVQALAGTGKTTTLKLLAEALSEKRGTYIAFNKAIVDEAQSKFPSNVKCRTAHSLAYGQVGYKFQKRINSHSRVTFRQIGEWLDAEKIGFTHNKVSYVVDSAQIANLALATISNFCKSVDFEISNQHVEIPFLASFDKKQTKMFQKEILPFAQKGWEDLQKSEGFLKFDHDYYLKMWQLGTPRISGEFILFDEAQDADPVMLSIVEAQTHAQRIYCGDEYQAIYEWRGAENALSKVKVDQHLWLTQSFRFGDAIAEEANDILSFLEAPVKVKGYSSVISVIKPLIKPKAILCRTNAGVIKHVMEELGKNRKVAIIGRTQELIEFAEACAQLQKGIRTGHRELAPFTSWSEAKQYVASYPDETHEIKTMIDLVERFGVEALIIALKKVVPESESDVLVSTAHRAKGREWDSVKLAGDYLHPIDMDTEDLRLAYVSVTRAINSLDMTEWSLITPRDSQEGFFTGEFGTVELNESEPAVAPRNGLRWTKEEDLNLVNGCLAGITFEELAATLGRTISALESRMGKWYLQIELGDLANDLESVSFSSDGWDGHKLDYLFEIWDQDLTIEELAKKLEVGVYRVASQVVKNDLILFDRQFVDAVHSYYARVKD